MVRNCWKLWNFGGYKRLYPKHATSLSNQKSACRSHRLIFSIAYRVVHFLTFLALRCHETETISTVGTDPLLKTYVTCSDTNWNKDDHELPLRCCICALSVSRKFTMLTSALHFQNFYSEHQKFCYKAIGAALMVIMDFLVPEEIVSLLRKVIPKYFVITELVFRTWKHLQNTDLSSAPGLLQYYVVCDISVSTRLY